MSSFYFMDMVLQLPTMNKITIIHDINITRWLCKRNVKKTYQVSKHHTNGLEDLSSRIKFRKIIKFIKKKIFNVKEIFGRRQ